MNERSRDIAFCIGRRVQARRESMMFSHEAVAAALRKPVAYLQDAEAGRVNFSAADIIEMCILLKVEPSWFFENLTSRDLL